MKILIVGGVAGGMSAATRLRRLMEEAEIVVFEKGPYVSFANCGLPYYVSGEIAERDSLLLQTPQSLHQRFNLDVRTGHEVIRIDPDKQEVTVRHEKGESVETYDRLILSPGAKPVLPQLAGIEEADNVYSLRNVPDLDRIMAGLEQAENGQVVIAGAGFIGLELAENLVKKGLSVTLVERAEHVLPPLDEEMASFVRAELEDKGVEVLTGLSLSAFEDRGRTLILDNGRRLNTDLTVLSVGVQPESSLAADAGIELGLRGGILVDDCYQTNLPNIYAVGDAIVVKQQITGQDSLISLASPANRQGRQVADVIAGLSRHNRGSIGTAIVRVFDLTVATTGLNEKQAREIDSHLGVVHTTGKDHAGYYPGAKDLVLKLLFSLKTGQLYGAQAVGQKGIDKRIDVLATAIKAGLTIYDLPELELTYAPPFGSAKDPVNMIGYAAMNLAEGLSQNIQWHELDGELAKGKILLDVRNAAELEKGRFKEGINIPLDSLRDNLSQLDKSKSYIISCHSGLRSYIAERLLKQEGFSVENLDGAFSLYKAVRPDALL